MRIRNKLTILLKLFIIASTFGGVVLSLIQATQDGYSHWSRRLLYFTAQSNLWIGSVCLLLVLSKALRFQKIWLKRLYVLKFIFTVSITITGLVFCTLLAPFAPKSYNLWVFSGYLTHVVSPVLALCDFFIDDYPLQIQRPHLWLSIIPPLFYFTSTMIFSFLKAIQ